MSTPAIVCTLEPSRMRDRLAFIDALARDAMLGKQEVPGGVRFRFRDGPDVDGRVRDLVAAESACCAFLTFAVGRYDGALWLEVTGPPDARPVIEQLFAAPRA